MALRGFHQMNDEEVARETGLSPREAHMARQRETGEPFLFQDSSRAAIRSVCRRAQERGYSVQLGGRFWHFSGGCDKGMAMSVLIGFYRIAWQTRIVTVALGDSGNDLPMFRLVDRPILIPRPDGTFATEVTQAMPRISRAKDPGASGWGAAILQVLQRQERNTKRPVARARGDGRSARLARG